MYVFTPRYLLYVYISALTHSRADRFRVPVDFLLQQVAYLTDRHATQVRAQVRKAAAAAKAPTPSATPIPGVDFALSAPGRERVSSLPLDTPLDGAALDDTPLEDVDLGGVPLADASLADTPPRSPPQGSVESASEDESSPAQSRIIRRPPRQVVPEGLDVFDEEDEEDEPAFQPYQKALQDLSSTLRGASKRSQASDSDTSLISRQNRTPGPLSPRRTAEMARSSSGKASSREGSDGTPSMGSSYSDLDGIPPPPILNFVGRLIL